MARQPVTDHVAKPYPTRHTPGTEPARISSTTLPQGWPVSTARSADGASAKGEICRTWGWSRPSWTRRASSPRVSALMSPYCRVLTVASPDTAARFSARPLSRGNRAETPDALLGQCALWRVTLEKMAGQGGVRGSRKAAARVPRRRAAHRGAVHRR
ncbi:hypothetical protein SSPO_010970 [Streptomyces antimycoticus]|uniref:Uncharacterized protein n=1 Tax=Streptomyces antimycoticus TaxID=68175 RepID=A0A499UML7_9ACTN|nr:hypothetical protein SSPO_010970 [Streptomyces antimycoticus]